MPPKGLYTMEQILEIAFETVRKHGMNILTARGLAAELRTSTAPIFTAFKSIEEIQSLVIEKAKQLYVSYLNAGLQLTPPFKGAGLKYIQFAKDEPELFKLLFMQGDENEEITHFFPAPDENTRAVLNALKSSHGLNEEFARRIYNHLSVYAHGLAVLYAQRRCVFTMEDVDLMLTEVFAALVRGGK